jgi:hypothetical protein
VQILLATFWNFVGIAIADLLVAIVAAIVLSVGVYFLMRPHATLRATFANRWILLAALVIGLAFGVIRWLQGAFSGL